MNRARPLLLAPLALLLACAQPLAAPALPPDGELWLAPASFEGGASSVAPVQRRQLPQTIAAGGRIAFDDQRLAHVVAPVTGRVTRVLAQLGQRVHKGTPLVALVSPDLGAAASDAVKARADLVAAEHDWKRQSALALAHANSSRDAETAEDNYRRAKAELERAEERLKLLRGGRLDDVTQEYLLPSPIDGKVIARAVNPGMEVQGQYAGGTSSGELFTVGSTDRVWLFVDLPGELLGKLQPGQRVSARVLAHPGQLFEGRIDWISPTLDPVLRTVRLRCTLNNPELLLKPEMFASVLIEQPAEEMLAIPRDALVRISDQSFVYVESGSREGKRLFVRRHIQVPERSGLARKRPSAHEQQLPVAAEPDFLPVLSGLAENEKVLVSRTLVPGHGADAVELPGAAKAKVTVTAAALRELRDTITVGGRLTFDDLRVAHVFSPVNGRITRLLAAPGQRVKKGAPLATLLSADLGSAHADELKARADLTAAEHEVKRQRELFEAHASAARDLEAAEDNFGKAKAEYDRASQKARLLRNLGGVDAVTQEFTLQSPIDGEVIARQASPGAEVQGQYASGPAVQELFTIGTIDQLWLLGDAYEVDLPHLQAGALVSLSVAAWPGRTFTGQVDWISDTLDPVLRTAKVRCTLKNQEKLLRPEMYEVARLSAPSRSQVTVPRDAVLRLGDETIVFVEEPSTAEGKQLFRRRRVTVDEQVSGDEVPVLSGLAAGERVASRGSIFLLGLL